MRLGLIPFQAGGLDRSRQYGLSISQSAHRRGIETRKRVKRTALEVDPGDGRVQKRKVEEWIVADQDCALAAGFAQAPPNRLEDVSQRLAFGHGKSQRMIGPNAVELQGRRLEVGALERFDVARDHVSWRQLAVLVHFDHA